MSDEHQQGPGPAHDRDATGWIILGALLIVGGFFLGARNFGLVPWQLGQAWDIMVKARLGIGVVLLGVLLIIWAQSGKGLRGPVRGRKLYRLRSDKWVAGVLGGLAEYFGFDATLLRLLFIGLLVLGVDGLILVYIVLAIVVPQEPEGARAVPAHQAPGAPQPSAPPAAPLPPPSPAAAPGEGDAPPPTPAP